MEQQEQYGQEELILLHLFLTEVPVIIILMEVPGARNRHHKLSRLEQGGPRMQPGARMVKLSYLMTLVREV